MTTDALDAPVLMNKAQRKDWRHYVFGCAELTVAQRLVLLALEGFADYPAGTNAHPGVKKLAEICALKTSAVEKALARGRDLELIRQTGRANPLRKLAAVYRLVPAPVSTPTAEQVEADSTRTNVRIDTPTDDNFNPYEPEFLPVRDDVSTRTAVQPTHPFTPSHSTEREKAVADFADDDLSEIPSREEEQEQPADPRPPTFCAAHTPNGAPDKVKCGDCGTRRVALAEWHKRNPEADAEPAPPAPVSTLNPDCRICGGFGHVLGRDSTPIEPAMACPLCRPARPSAAAYIRETS